MYAIPAGHSALNSTNLNESSVTKESIRAVAESRITFVGIDTSSISHSSSPSPSLRILLSVKNRAAIRKTA